MRDKKPTQDTDLFRPEALDNLALPAYGRIVLARPPALRWLTVLFLSIALASGVFLALASYTRKVVVSGMLEPEGGARRIVSPVAGVVQRAASEGAVVKLGQVLYVVTDVRAQHDADTDRALRQLAASRVDNLELDRRESDRGQGAQIDALKSSGAHLEAQIGELKVALKLQQDRIALADARLQRFSELERSGFITQGALDEHRTALIDQQQRLSDMRQQLDARQREAASTRAEIESLLIQRTRDLASNLREVAVAREQMVERASRHEWEVVAPGEGTLGGAQATEGQSVSQGQLLATLVPGGARLLAVLFVPSEASGFISVGQRVSLRVAPFAFERYGQVSGQISEIARVTLQPEDMASARGIVRSGLPTYGVKVILDRQFVDVDGMARPMQAGAMVEASILLERRRLAEWVLRPFQRLLRVT